MRLFRPSPRRGRRRSLQWHLFASGSGLARSTTAVRKERRAHARTHSPQAYSSLQQGGAPKGGRKRTTSMMICARVYNPLALRGAQAPPQIRLSRLTYGWRVVGGWCVCGGDVCELTRASLLSLDPLQHLHLPPLPSLLHSALGRGGLHCISDEDDREAYARGRVAVVVVVVEGEAPKVTLPQSSYAHFKTALGHKRR